jgi:hypothetical protein
LVYSRNKAITDERCCRVAHIYYGSPSYKGLLGVFDVRYMLSKKKMLDTKHGCQGYHVCLIRDENIQKTWLRDKKETRRKDKKKKSKGDYSSQA